MAENYFLTKSMKVKRDHEATPKERKTIKRKINNTGQVFTMLFSLDLSVTNSRVQWENSLELIASIDSVCGGFFVRPYPNSEGRGRP